ncbi:3'(2'),5'-bisphosphate nucleotidase CysQ family protein [Alicyclobacillus acidiphilus]|uniref:3'(2'),5'-bisphosphate nucleotidase CysQ family protein n=1 Tax=Alicyclobacillus acidiphilus TaxID=182455 RepID=UPI000833378D|nr:3'(2'),5'-bisphosphate nucleotidase CysQ [Alicyclobacillus acidiphilus]
MERECEVLEAAVRKAGKEVVRISKEGYETSRKADDDILTTADLAANRILLDAVRDAFPDDGFLSEESVDNGTRLTRKRVWIIDPIDGTKEFVRGLPEYTISVALVVDGVPELGVVYNPMTDEYFLAQRGFGSYLDGKRTHVRQLHGRQPLVLCSRTEWQRGYLARYDGIVQVRPMGSIAYKLALVSAGLADATFSMGRKHDWDIAAGILLVQEAGGTVTDKHGHEIRFHRETTLVDGIVAATEDSVVPLREFLSVLERQGLHDPHL